LGGERGEPLVGYGAKPRWVAGVARAMILHLYLSDCVEHVDKLRLTILGGRLKRVEFHGIRHRRYANVPPFEINIDRATDL